MQKVCRNCQEWRNSVLSGAAPVTPLNSTTTADSHAATQERLAADATSLPPTKVSKGDYNVEPAAGRTAPVPPPAPANRGAADTFLANEFAAAEPAFSMASIWASLTSENGTIATAENIISRMQEQATRGRNPDDTGSTPVGRARPFGGRAERQMDRVAPSLTQREAQLKPVPVYAPPYDEDGSDEDEAC